MEVTQAQKTYPEILNNRVHLDICFIVSEGILELQGK
jgi:hypothetical protein